MERHAWTDEIREHFGQLPDKEEVWPSVRESLSIGETVRGRIVGRAPFGVWLDIGQPILALLEVPAITEPDFNYTDYANGQWGSLGTELTANVVYFHDDTCEIRLDQNPVEPAPPGAA